jgi:hypothetical protein
VLAGDYSAANLNSAAWTPEDGRWWSAPAFSQQLRIDPWLRGRAVPAPRSAAAAVYRRLGGGELPCEEVLRGYFGEGTPLSAPPLRLDTVPVAAGGDQTRVYRILFAKDLGAAGLANLWEAWRMEPAGARTGVVGTARRCAGGDVFSWDLRRIGTGAAWCVDLTASLPGTRRSDRCYAT